jgi:UDP-galactopyranose mutase
VNEKIKVMPKYGYTELFKKMLKNNKIDVLLNTDYKKIKNKIIPKIATIYTGPPDLFFKYKYGRLQWRSLDFKFKTIKRNYFQKYVQINFPNEKNYTRRVEIKHVTKQKSKFTTLSYEYPKSSGDPYYPINNDINKKKFNKYQKLIKNLEKKNIFFEGRLAKYKYLNMDEVIENALLLFYKLKKKYS